MLSRQRHLLIIPCVATMAAVFAVGPVRGQGMIVDRRPHMPLARAYEIRDVSIDARVR
jgi:hypothetical protein